MGVLPDLALPVGAFPQAALALGSVGDGEAREESHDCLLLFDLRHWLNQFASDTNTS
jgi:hypothetical protein